MALIPKRDADVKTRVHLKETVTPRTMTALRRYAKFRDEDPDNGGVGFILDLLAEHALAKDKEFAAWQDQEAVAGAADNSGEATVTAPTQKRRGRRPKAKPIDAPDLDRQTVGV